MKNQDPIKLLAMFSKEPEMFFLDSALSTTASSMSYFGILPVDVIKVNSFDDARLRKIKLPAIGVIGYDGQMRFSIYDVIISLNYRREISFKAFQQTRKLNQIKEYIAYNNNHPSGTTSLAPRIKKSLVLKAAMTSASYQTAVKRTLTHIHDGDIYQLNLTYARTGSLRTMITATDAVNIYQQLRQHSPTHLSAFIKAEGEYILSSSPERFCSLNNRTAILMPMKGTRPRSGNKALDDKYRRELLESPKEKAELLMVTDLARNDLGRVCEFGSVKVSRLRAIEQYAKVYQATATVTGKIRRDKGIIDLLQAAFPSGSVTGCPKLEAMTIIKKLEKNKRGLYTGALGYFNINNCADFNVLIRTIFLKGREVSFHVGSGIVADSKPKAEYDETLLKSAGMIDAIAKGLNVKVTLS